MSNKASFLLLFFLSLSLFLHVNKAFKEDASGLEPVVRKDERRQLVVTEYGEVSAIEIGDGARGQYHLQFITLDPNSLFLPVLLHADMVLYVHTGAVTFSLHIYGLILFYLKVCACLLQIDPKKKSIIILDRTIKYYTILS